VSPRLEHLTAEDAEILALESGAIAGHTLKVAIAARPPDGVDPVEALRERVAAARRDVPRCGQRLVPTPLGVAPPAWVDDPHFDPRRHVRRLPTTGSVDREALLSAVSRSMCEHLERDRPLWSIEVLEGLEDGNVAYLLKVHHCMADGSGALKVASALLWGPDPGAGGVRPAPPGTGSLPGRAGLLASGAGARVREAGATAAGVARAAASRSGWRSAATEIARAPATISRELRSGPNRSPFDAPISRSRQVAFVSSPLDDLHRGAHAAGATLNDAVLAAVAGGLRRWLATRAVPLPEMRVKIPVSMHAAGEGPAALGNRDSFFFVDLPLTEPDPRRRLEAIRGDTALRKREHDAETLYVLFNDLSHLSRRVYRRADAIAGRPGVFSLCVSNVPGPKERREVLGAPIHELHTLAEVGEHHGLRVSALSHAGSISLGVCADAAAVTDLDVLASGLEDSLSELAALR
jgi:WS/DGAT/MGAT family acyltransferase